jgi:ABC-2 type transport system ATP-binding protein
VRPSRPAAIEVVGVAKRFRKHSEPAKTLKERLLTLRHSTVDDFYALDGLDFEVGVGETFGVLGHNGSGKSTLLKCIAGTLRPSQGTVRVRGRLSALLELGAGFHPDLTGRENVYLNGSILGFSRTRIDAIFDEIVAFSGLEDFIDTQVKHYSSGMYARLGFAVAINVDPEVLLIDEVLAVGDEAFQRKCIERIRAFQSDGRTICLVTHSPDQVRYLCDRALVLDHGKLIHVGGVDEAVSVYRHSLAIQSSSEPAETVDLVEPGPPTSPVTIAGTWVEPSAAGGSIHRPGDRVVIGIRLAATDARQVRARLVLHAHDGIEMLNVCTFDVAGRDLTLTEPEHEVRFVIDDIPFLDGQFLVTVVITDPAETEEYDRQDQALAFGIHSGQHVFGRVALDLSIDSDALVAPASAPSPDPEVEVAELGAQ